MKIFGNELWRYVVFFLLISISWLFAKSLKFILNNYILKWTKRTKFKFDDIVFNSISPSVSLFVLAGMYYIGISFLNLGRFQVLADKILSFLIIIPLVYFLIKFSTEIIKFYLKEETDNKRINEAGIDLLIQIIRIVLFLIGILLILANLGYDVSALLAGLGVGGLAFALAAQDILKNFFAGIALIFDKTFNKKERVNFQGNVGIIEQINLRTTKIRTYDKTLLTIPNAMLADNIVENITKSPKVKVKHVIGLTYDTSSAKLKQAKEIIEKAILNEKHTDKESYWIYFDNFNAYSLDIQVIYYGNLTQDDWPEKVLFKERINFEIKEKFEKAGIEMAFPTQTLEIKKQ
ncbi:MAG: mechanosensitive ion channel [Nanoarchaeota archaeon]|nr:mechanosensitive ion channel [Nanoarchaeota archaeon]